MEENRMENINNEEQKNEEVKEVKESKWKKFASAVVDGTIKYGPKVAKGALTVSAVGVAFMLGKGISNKNQNSGADYEVGESNDDYTTFVEANEE